MLVHENSRGDVRIGMPPGRLEWACDSRNHDVKERRAESQIAGM